MAIWLWIGFLAIILVLLALDLGVFHRRDRVVTVSAAVIWTGVWIGCALLFNVAIHFIYQHHLFGMGLGADHATTGRQAALEFFTGYIIEKSLSLDNIFVIALIFSYFNTPAAYQHRVLYWGILGALVMRGGMIAAGAVLIRKFAWVIYLFGALLIITALRLLFARHDQVDPERNLLVRLARRVYPVSVGDTGHDFFTRIDGRRAMTPLFIALITVESSDLLFAVDSIPAIFAVTYDPFIVFTSNVFAILGLRSLYFVLAGVMGRFRYLKSCLVLVLLFVGVKMLLAHHYAIPTWISLVVICVVLAGGVIASLLHPLPPRD